MTQETLNKINSSISRLQAETKFLRSFVIGMLGKDQEGEYNPEFVKKALKSAVKDGKASFSDKKSFLKKIRG
ncbi:MAG: hypothetical protein PHN39_03185 [Candidatus Pacebacteria bacterium]|nr:hypothetical protein [Candidatus Paceibacterota bacterium]